MTSAAPVRSDVAPPERAVRVGVIGTGAMGRDHVANLDRFVPAATVSAVYDRATEVATRVAAPVKAQVACSPQALVDSAEVDAVIICSPDPTHRELVLHCLATGKPVLCEKPLASDAEGTAEVVEAEVALNRRLVQVGFMRRFDPAYLRLKHRLHDGSQGEPVLLHCVHRNPSNAAAVSPELVVSNSMVHELDLARWLLDDEVRTVTTRAVRRRRGAWVEGDPVIAWLEMASGAVVEVEVFGNAGYGYDIRCEAVGARGTSSLPAQVVADFQTRFAEAYRDELGAWVESVRSGRATGPSSWDGHRASVAAAACMESLHRDVPVSVPVEDRPALYG